MAWETVSVVAEDVWDPYERYVAGVLQIDAVMGWWQRDGSLTSREFTDHVETLLASPKGERWRQVSTADMVPSDPHGDQS